MAGFSELSASEREALALLYSQTGEVPAHALGLAWPDLDALLERRLVERDGEALRLAESTRDAIARGALSASELSKAHLLAAAWYALLEPEPGGGKRAARVVHHLVLGGDVARAEALFKKRAAGAAGRAASGGQAAAAAG